MRPVIADLGCAEIRSVDLLNSVQRRLRQRAEFDGFQCLIQVRKLGHADDICVIFPRSGDMPQDLDTQQDLDPGTERFVLGILIDQAHRLGETALADAHFERLRQGPGADVPSLVQWADVLLDRGRDREVVALLRDEAQVDALHLRHALALSRLGSPDLEGAVSTLSSRFASARRRGEDHHQGEESRFHLHLLGDVDRALDLARGNWLQQREPADARRLLEAALAADDPSAAEPVLRWRQATGIEDLQLDRLARALTRRVEDVDSESARPHGGAR